MYQYFYDYFLSEEKYGKILSLIESRISDLGLQGRIERLNLFKDIRELIADGFKKGVKTVVAVGNDLTLNQVINGIGDTDVTVGFIPVGPQNEIAKALGVGEGVLGCDCLASRLIQRIDLGKINSHYFLSHVRTLSEGVHLKCGSDYCIRPLANYRVEIYNLPVFGTSADPQDGYLEARVRPVSGKLFGGRKKAGFIFNNKSSKENTESFFPVKKIFLESGGEAQILVDGLKTVATPAEIRVIPQKLKIIVGKNRFF